MLTPRQEAKTGIIDIKDDKSAVIREMLLFIYSSDYCAPPLDDNPVLFHVQVYAAGEKFGVGGLKELARDKFAAAMQSRKEGFDVPAIIEAVYAASDCSDRILRETLLQLIQPQLLQLVDDEEFCDLLQTVDGLSADILRAQVIPKRILCNSSHCRMFRDVIYCCTHCGESRNLQKPGR